MKTTELAHFYWRQWICPRATVIDATCGNGHDTLFLAQLLNGEGEVIGYDIQKEAIENTQECLNHQWANVVLRHASHENFVEKEAHAIIYNLGYLPGSDKKILTRSASTLKSLTSACSILVSGGFISMTLYPGHPEGEEEEKEVLEFASKLSASEWEVLHHRWINRHQAPSLLLMRRKEHP